MANEAKKVAVTDEQEWRGLLDRVDELHRAGCRISAGWRKGRHWVRLTLGDCMVGAQAGTMAAALRLAAETWDRGQS